MLRSWLQVSNSAYINNAYIVDTTITAHAWSNVSILMQYVSYTISRSVREHISAMLSCVLITALCMSLSLAICVYLCCYSGCGLYTDPDTAVVTAYYYPNDATTQYLYESYPDVVTPLQGVKNEHFIVWMR
jgi:hypothetical protein